MMPDCLKRLRGLVLAFAACNAYAIEPVKVTLEFQPDPDNGRYVFEICARCHLPEAWGDKEGNYPQLAGQHVNVLMKQLLDIRTGHRDNPTMLPFVQERTIGGYQNLVDVVAYISTLPMAPIHSQGPWPDPDSAEYRQGMRLYQAKCSGCHGASGEGVDAAHYPRLQGQHFSYMKRQALSVREGLRKVDPAMTAVLDALSDDELEKVLSYISYLPVPREDLAPSAEWRNPDFQ
ncbi:MAG: c-type cytochrome [Gammaproteobacteria bacterium]|nr:c-type cytochrome [Gammaproteobacteria bacterium]